jgi:hypothetical protein
METIKYPPDRFVAPWTPDQVEALNRWQGSDEVHPFRCGCGAVLRASAEGWRCDDPERNAWDGPPGRLVQDWAHAFMAD